MSRQRYLLHKATDQPSLVGYIGSVLQMVNLSGRGGGSRRVMRVMGGDSVAIRPCDRYTSAIINIMVLSASCSLHCTRFRARIASLLQKINEMVHQVEPYKYRQRTLPYQNSCEVQSEEELHNELCTLFESAYRNSVPIGTISTWVCRHEHIPEKEIMITELAKR